MATKEIKQRITLDGEKQYNQAIREAMRNLRTLKSELKAETAELGKNATEQQKNETRAKSLRKQIAEQEKVVRTLREALQEAKENYGDNADVVQKWEQKLNDARATLGNMKNELDGLGQGFRKAGEDAQMGTVAAKSFADSIGKIADAGEAVSTGIENIFRGMVDVVSEAIGAVWEDMMELASKANAWVDIAGFWNTDAETIQKWSHAVKGAANTFDDLQNAVTRINMGDQKKIAEATGVSGENYADKWKYAMAVMDALAGMDYESRLEAAGEVFGEKRATKVLDILNEWGTIQEKLARFDVENGGVGMTEEQINNMATLAEQVATIKETWQAFLDSFEAEHFGKLALDLTGNAQRILDDLIKFLDTGSDEDLAQLEKDVTEFFERIKQALEAAAEKLNEAGKKLEESDNGIVKAIGKAMQGLASALEWISDENNIQRVIAGFETLAAFWIAGKGLQLVGSIAELAANFKVIQGFGMAGAAASAAGSAGTTVASLGSSIASALASVALGVTIVGIAAAVLPTIAKLIQGETPEEKQAREDAEKVSQIGQGLKEAGAPIMNSAETWEYLRTGRSASYEQRVEAYKKEQEASIPRTDVENNGVLAPKQPFDATAEQQAAAEAFWDAWRNLGTAESDEEFNNAWDLLQASFEGNEKEFERLNGWLDQLMESMNARENEKDFNEADWYDLPAKWWKNPAGNGEQGGLTSSDLAGFRGLPAQMIAAVQAGASAGSAAGVSGIKVLLDGATVGRLVAPYVSQTIARDIII